MFYDNTKFSGGDEISNCFSQYFSSVFNPPITVSHTPVMNDLSLIYFNLYTLSLTYILYEIDHLTNNTNHGSDNISNIFFKEYKFVLAVPLLYLFNLSLKSGIFPARWKLSYVTPVFKGGDNCLITNYRPISIISIIPKIFESILVKILTPLFKNIIIEEQHGFFSGRSTATNLLVFQNYVLDAFNTNCQVDVIYTDFPKAFDKIDHIILAVKLHNLGFRNPFYSWLVSFISGRKQYIKLKNYESPVYHATSGIPQGSHLAPLLFKIYVNDIEVTNSRLLFFADDLKISRIIKSHEDANMLQFDLNIHIMISIIQ